MTSLLSRLWNAGPGWLGDVFTIQIFFDSDFEDTSAPPYVERVPDDTGVDTTDLLCHRSIFASMAKIQGTIRVTGPRDVSVPHSGISIRFESSFVVEDDGGCRDLHIEELELVPPGEVLGVLDVPFVFEGCARASLLESVEGSLFSVRHNITARVARPWYAFEVVETVPVSIQRIFDIPHPSLADKRDHAGSVSLSMCEGETGHEAETGNDKSDEPLDARSAEMAGQLALYGPQEVATNKLADGGKLVVHFDKGCFAMTDEMCATLQFSDITTPVVCIQLVIDKVERYRTEEPVETTIFEEVVLDARIWKEAKRQRLLAQKLRTRATAAEEELVDDQWQLMDEEERTSWLPTEADYAMAGEEGGPDPNLPVIGDVNLSVNIDLSVLQTPPTTVIDLASIEREPETVTNKPALNSKLRWPVKESRVLEPSEEASIRYFMHINVYTDFKEEDAVTVSHELVLYRNELHGAPVAPNRVYKPAAASQGRPPTNKRSSVRPVDIPLVRKSSTASASSGARTPRTPNLPAGAASPNPRLALSGDARELDEEGDEMLDAEEGFGSIELTEAAIPVTKARASSTGSVASSQGHPMR